MSHRPNQHPRPTAPLIFDLRPYHRDTPNTKILQDLRRAAATTNSKIVTQETYKRLGMCACSTVIRRFGTWNSAITAAGLTPSLLTHTTPTQLLDDIKSVAKKLRLKKMLLRQYTQHGHHSSMVIQRHFKTCQHAARAAGLTPAKFQNIPTSALLADIEQVWRRLGQQPAYSQMHPPLSRYNIMTHCRHFGGFQNALKTFIKHINGKTLHTNRAGACRPGPHPNRQSACPEQRRREIGNKNLPLTQSTTASATKPSAATTTNAAPAADPPPTTQA